MMRTGRLLCVALLAGCASLAPGGSRDDAGAELWAQAHQALAVADFSRASVLFTRLSEERPGTREGRESLFYLGTIRLDPRNPGWDPQPAERHLRQYLARDSAVAPLQLPRGPEAQTLLELAAQLNMPAEQRVAGLQPETRVVQVPQRVVVPARESRALQAEVERLRREVASRDEQIRQQREELERIRKTLTGSGRQ